jgi:spermidine synthase
MNVTIEPSIAGARDGLARSRSDYLAVGLMSFSALLLELALTRLFSVVLYYHFAFLAISIALLGLGAGAVLAYLRRRSLKRWTIKELGPFLCSANALIIVGTLATVLHSAVTMHPDWLNFRRLTALYLAAATPFFIAGLLFSVVYARKSRQIPALYSVDLVGGAIACLAFVPLLDATSAPNVILLAAVGMALAGATWGSGRGRIVPLALVLSLLALVALNYRGKVFDIVYAKGQPRPHVLFAKWNALSRVEVDNVDKRTDVKSILIDADAGTQILNADPPHPGEDSYRSLMSTAPAIANVLRPRGKFCIIGPGGGVDVLRALANGSPHVTGIEINPIIATDIMRGRFADYAHHLYDRREVHMHIGDGRSFIRNSRERYDVVQMTLVDTWAATAAGTFALSENNLYTVEAFREYFEHLNPDGMIAITRWEFAQPREALRVVSEAMEALRQLGIMDSTSNFVVVSDGDLDMDGRPVVVLAKKTAFTDEEQRRVLQHITEATTEDGHRQLRVLYMPMTSKDPALTHPVFAGLVRSQDPRAFSANYGFNVAPVDDDAPFFFFTLKPRLGFQQLAHGIDRKMNVGVVVLDLLVVISAGAVGVFLFLPLALSPQTRSGSSIRLLYFIAIGLGYMMVEITLIQRFVLFLGHPTYALTVVVFLMLLSGGVGSLLSRNWFAEPRRVVVALVFVVATLLISVFTLSRLLAAIVGLPFAVKLFVSAILIGPLGLAMGMPLPSGLRALSSDGERSQTDDGAIEWAWAMNAAASVLGSVLAIVIAIRFGLNVTLAYAAVAYLAAIALIPILSGKEVKRPLGTRGCAVGTTSESMAIHCCRAGPLSPAADSSRTDCWLASETLP